MFVFPAFDSNYKTRKRTFRCCKKCRNKRIRCIILNADYEIHGCDNCRARSFTCDLIKPHRVKTEDSVFADGEKTIPPEALSPDIVSNSDLVQAYALENQYAQPAPTSGIDHHDLAQLQGHIQNNSHHQVNNLAPTSAKFQAPSPPLSNPSNVLTYLFASSASPCSQNIAGSVGNILGDRGQGPPNSAAVNINGANPAFTSGSTATILSSQVASNGSMAISGNTAVMQNMLVTHGHGDRGVLLENITENYTEERSGSESWQFTPPFPPNVSSGPHVPSIENIDSMIDKIDWRYLKRYFDFNTTIRQSRYYFAKTLTRKGCTSLKEESLSEVLAKKHSVKPKKLRALNALHFKFLLSFHAFTLNTPGFYEISDTDLLHLFEIYFYKVNSVLPIVFEAEFWELYKRNKIPTIIVYAIVLVISRDQLAEPILARSFVHNGATFRENQVRFLTELEMKIRQLLMFLPELGDTEKLARLITQLLLSLNFKFNKFGNEQSSHDLAECISYAYSLLIHQEFFHVRIAKEGAQKKSVYLKHLWWVIFIFDRFNALMNGKAMFIKRLDFNVARPTDMPSLDQLVSLAYTLEDTLIAVSRPPRIIDGKEVIATQETLVGDPEFRPAAFIEQEMQLIKDREKLQTSFTEYRQFENLLNSHLPGIPVEMYRDRVILFLSRILSNQIVLILRTGQVKYSDDAPDMDEFSLILSESFMSLLDMLRDGRGSQLTLEIPLIPLIMLVAFSVPLTTRIRLISKLKNIGNTSIDFKKVQKVMDLSQIYLKELKKFGEKWWFVNEVVSSIESVNMKMTNLNDKPVQPKKRKKSIPDEPVVKRERLSIDSLVTDPSDVESVLPPLLSITSPGFYDEVITKGESDEEEDEESGDELLDTTAGPEDDLISMKTLVPPMMRNFSIPSFMTAEDLASRAQEIRNLATNVDFPFEQGPTATLLSSRDSVTSADDVNFDVGQLAELVTDETSFMPSALDFWNEHELSL